MNNHGIDAIVGSNFDHITCKLPPSAWLVGDFLTIPTTVVMY